MTRDEHKRFLNYLEKHQYFPDPRRERLNREQWLAFDRERRPLEEKAKLDHLTAADLVRLEALRRVLLVD